MNIIIVLVVGMVLGFALGWAVKPKYANTMSRVGQILVVAVATLVAALVVGMVLELTGWALVAVCLVPLVIVAPYAGGFVHERVRAKTRQ